MRRNLIITASILVLVGGAALGWVLNERSKDWAETAQYEGNCDVGTDDFIKQYNDWLQTPPQERGELPYLRDEYGITKTRGQLRQEQQARLKTDLDKLAAGKITAPHFVDDLYGEGWHDEVTEYQKRREFLKTVLNCSIISASAGGAIYAGWLLMFAARLTIKGASRLKRRIRGSDDDDDDDAEDESLASCEQEFLQKKEAGEEQSGSEPPSIEDFLRNKDAAYEQSEREPRPRTTVKPVLPVSTDREHRPMGSLTQRATYSMEREKLPVVTSDEKSSDIGVFVGGADKFEELDENAMPIDNTLTDLSEQVSAIREYAANQQDRLEKLQDGYDWNIIRTFCLRVIRCIDNLETRINRLKKENTDVIHLEEVKDELIFALESSGIEQYEPETGSEYRGQEKFAEAVKDKQDCKNPKKAGKIAAVVRPGYQYFIDDDNVKIVRAAQVRLYA
ncbi:MAG: nucleotide exchange factor GrpE [Planctomycetota bacterium]|jgi:molecular chaperone GrpE (heat shock protein)